MPKKVVLLEGSGDILEGERGDFHISVEREVDKFIGLHARPLEPEESDREEDEEVEGEYLAEKNDDQDYLVSFQSI